ncbi:hypothetical protein E1180_01340 [Roseibium denhamense]|uniref:Dodecin n=1 Tax=Roseibium denhamense TaxID=76305 RepID=A0ABY1NEY0_9HYPH|nr:dodecin domain-containing protein [Roseibium denhamense]MTI04161.1 hypothetical protein [Roseibium denhamense]SMP07404.1 Dodecin [Roseibium denhamense]
MAVDQQVLHNLTVTGFSDKSFDDAVKNAIQGAWENHHEEFSRFVHFTASDFQGEIGADLQLTYCVTVTIGAVHAKHAH